MSKATTKISIEAPQSAESVLDYDLLQQSYYWVHIERNLTVCQRDICTPFSLLTAALSAIARQEINVYPWMSEQRKHGPCIQ